MKANFFRATSLLFAMTFCLSGVALSEEVDLGKKLDECAEVLDEIMMVPEESIPEDLLSKAKAIGIFPSMVSGAYIIGGRYGQGVIVARKPKTGKWSDPAFFTIGGASLGFQIGGQATDVIFVITTQKGLDGLLKDKFTFGGDTAVAAGPVGRKAELSTDLLMKAGILSYSRSKGLFAGAALQGAYVTPNKENNDSLYGPDVTVEDILSGKARTPKEAQALIKTLKKYAH